MGIVLRLFSLVLILFSSFVHAEDYYFASLSLSPTHYPDALSACVALYPGNFNYNIFALNQYGGYCNFSYTDAQGNTQTTGSSYANPINRYGDGCSSGTVNPSTLACAAPSNLNDGDICPDQTGAIAGYPMVFDGKAGKCVGLMNAQGKAYCKGAANAASASGNVTGSTYVVPGVLDRAGNLVAPPTFAQQGTDCQLATIGESDCKINISGNTICNVTATLTGELNSSGNISTKQALCGNGTPCADVAPATQNQKSPCSLAGPSSSQGCTSLDQTVTDGTQNCQSSTVNGVYSCVTKPPTSNGLKIDTTVSSTTNPDGSADVVKTDNATKTNCTDIGVCTSQTSTTTTTTHTSATGGTNTTTTCKGVCSSDGTGLTPGKGGSGTGDGSGGGQASASDDCSKPVICSGDIFQCAILNQQYLDMCTLRKLPTDTEKQQLADSITAENADIAANQKQLDDTASSVFNTFKSTASGSGGSSAQCLPDYPFTVMGRSITMKFSAACDYLSAIRYAILCIAYLIASRIISKEL